MDIGTGEGKYITTLCGFASGWNLLPISLEVGHLKDSYSMVLESRQRLLPISNREMRSSKYKMQ